MRDIFVWGPVALWRILENVLIHAVEAISCFVCLRKGDWILFLADGVTIVFVLLKEVILAAEWNIDKKLEGQDW